MYFDLQDCVFADSEHGYHVGYGLSIIPFVLRTSLLIPIVQENLRSKVIPVKLKLCPFNHISPLPFSSFPDPPAWLYFLHKINFPLLVCLPTNKSDCLWITHCALQVLMIFLIDVSQVIGGGGACAPSAPMVPTPMIPTCMYTLTPVSVLVPCMDQVYWPSLPQHPYMIIHCSAYATELIVLSQRFFYAAHRSTQILLCMHRYHGTAWCHAHYSVIAR